MGAALQYVSIGISTSKFICLDADTLGNSSLRFRPYVKNNLVWQLPGLALILFVKLIDLVHVSDDYKFHDWKAVSSTDSQ
uniref:Uncharacterized protein n=1 Tax=Physcomitrium patens TaxID=3218 RepID=A0A2K1IIE0_PHYPA|nr:hypothetical protein PHYPA_027732 [Physcomitrium patens]